MHSNMLLVNIRCKIKYYKSLKLSYPSIFFIHVVLLKKSLGQESIYDLCRAYNFLLDPLHSDFMLLFLNFIFLGCDVSLNYSYSYYLQVKNKAELYKVWDDYNVGDKVVLKILRGSEYVELPIVLEEKSL